MNNNTQADGIILLIILSIVLAVVIYKVIKPFFIRYDTTILFTGGLGSGKTLESVKKSVFLLKKMRLKNYYWNNFKCRFIINPFRRARNVHYFKIMLKSLLGKYKKEKKIKFKEYQKVNKKPLLYSNIPVHYKTWLFGRKEWAVKLKVDHILLLKEINEYSIVFIDEFPQFISQFDWDIELVQKNCNEFITFFRHYIGGHLITNAQSEDEIECHFRRKLNIGIWCFDFKKHLFGLFYTNRMCTFMLSENVQTMSTTYIEENTKLHFGFFTKCYDSRCYKPRYKKVKHKIIKTANWKELQTTEVLRLRPYISPLDTKTTVNQIEQMEKEARKLERNADQ